MLKKIDEWLNSVMMYKLVLYGLMIVALAAVLFGFTGVIAYSGWSLLLSLVIALNLSYALNLLCARLWRAQINAESAAITGLIVFLIMGPVTSTLEVVYLAVTVLVAILSKYLLAYRHKHIFNPAAIAAVVIGSMTGYAALWWLATWKLLPLVLPLSLLVVRKTRREALFVATMLTGLFTALLYTMMRGVSTVEALRQFFLAGPMIFFVGVMVTEPLCMPARRKYQIVYGMIIGFLANWPFHFGVLYSSPELALVLANIWSFAVGQKRRLYLLLKEKTLIATNTYEFVFGVDHKLKWLAGQYLEITLPHEGADRRGVRRYFTISSAPSEGVVKLGVKVGEPASSFKQKLLSLKIGDKITAGQIAGDFVLPTDKNWPLIFIAGGIGITPFCSMIRQLMDSGDEREIKLFYAGRSRADLAYQDLLAEACAKLKLKVFYVVNNLAAGETSDGQVIDESLIGRLAPDYLKSEVYISGPSAMVSNFKQMLKKMGVTEKRIKTDYFPGFS